MKYYMDKKMECTFDQAENKVTAALKREGFGVLTEICVNEVFKKKLGVDFRNYKILGACNPNFAHQALTYENKIGTMLPCNIILQELTDGAIEVAAVDPMASMMAVENERLAELASEVKSKLNRVMDSL